MCSRDNPRFKMLRQLAASARERRKAGLALLDGVHLIEAYRASGGVPEQLILSESGGVKVEAARLAQSQGYPAIEPYIEKLENRIKRE